jgi:hypothetical protein
MRGLFERQQAAGSVLRLHLANGNVGATMTSRHLTSSEATNFANSSGALAVGSAPSSMKRCRTSRSCIAASISL